MTEKEFHKMKRPDLIQLLLAQSKEASQMQECLDKKNEELASLREHNDSLKEKLDSSDARIEEVKKALDEKDARLRELAAEKEAMHADRFIDLETAGSLVQEAQKLMEIFRKAQWEADQYIPGRQRQTMPVAANQQKRPSASAASAASRQKKINFTSFLGKF